MSGVSKASRQQQRDIHWLILAIAAHTRTASMSMLSAIAHQPTEIAR
jgi:hypothetical protein